jgi:hypothetical protein
MMRKKITSLFAASIRPYFVSEIQQGIGAPTVVPLV